MRWLPTLIFSPSSSHSSKVSSASSSSSSSSSSTITSPSTLKHSPSSSDVSDTRKPSRGMWFFGSGRKSTRSRKLRHVDVVHIEYDVASAPVSRSPSTRSYIRSSTSSSVAPQPLPLPELASPAGLQRHRDGDLRLPSPKEASGRSFESDVHTVVSLPTGFKMRSVFASRESRKNTEHMETKPPGNMMVRQDTSGAATPSFRENSFRISVPPRSASSSPFTSPTTNNTKHDDFVPYYYVSPKANQFWSAPEMPTSTGQPPPAFFDLSALRIDCASSPHQSSGGKSPKQQNPSSPLPRLSLDYPTPSRRESLGPPLSVHPLPLPPWSGSALPSPSATYSQPGGTKTESVSMKSQWQKGKLIGRGTFGSVYVATNRETGALCAMKEAEIFSDDPKSAESIKQLDEIKVLSHLKHPNIVQYYGSEIVEDKFYIYLEFIHPGSINKYVRDHCGAITESVVRNFTRHILSGLAYLHSKKTIHRDIKGANLLVDSSGVVKLADFGMAKHDLSFEVQGLRAHLYLLL
ncbi:mitogen-activated protein kinase kinase kinase 5 [Lathyrus oleraceus]|uniref:mitogen-activated protein kinase kinase kinase 5 n=1 Tax=Pisum sativum TaxID=3888 RepID=UPI0021CEE3A2|nr:mitogen-activated protein kinase kinase kinase 5-like [Pisum sativum]